MCRSPCGGGLQGERTALLGKTPSNMTCNAGDEPWGSMDGADKSSAPSIPGPGCAPRQSSSYGRCFARSRRQREREGGLQNGDRPPPDAALRLARRKRRNSLPRPQSASGLRSDSLKESAFLSALAADIHQYDTTDNVLKRTAERAELTPNRLFSPARRNCSREAYSRRGRPESKSAWTGWTEVQIRAGRQSFQLFVDRAEKANLENPCGLKETR